MMWVALAFLSAALLGCYDVFKKHSLRDNAVIPVLLLNTFFCSLIFIPFIVASATGVLSSDSFFYVSGGGWDMHKFILLKAVIVLSSWSLGYIGIKHLPLTIVGPINATRPVMVLVGALLVFGERLNFLQWVGVGFAILSFFLLSRSGKREGISFSHNRWILCIVAAAVLGAVSGLYDKYLLAPIGQGGVGLDKMAVQGWYNLYQCVMMLLVFLLAWVPLRRKTTPFHWDWCIIGISLFLSVADFVYFYALSLPDAMISVVSMIRRGSVLVSSLFGAMLFKEKNLKAKSVDLLLVLVSMLFLWLGTR
jgi:bacterial/archaeal transporter family protein